MSDNSQAEPKLAAAEFPENDAQRVPFAGLLTAKPELRDKQLTRSEWQKHLDAYLRSPRP